MHDTKWKFKEIADTARLLWNLKRSSVEIATTVKAMANTLNPIERAEFDSSIERKVADEYTTKPQEGSAVLTIRMSSSLHKKVIELSKRQDKSMNSYCVELLYWKAYG